MTSNVFMLRRIDDGTDVCVLCGLTKLRGVEDLTSCTHGVGANRHIYARPWSEVTHRMRRGRLVEIPEVWRGRTVSSKTINRRQSKAPRKLRRFGCKQSRTAHDRGPWITDARESERDSRRDGGSVLKDRGPKPWRRPGDILIVKEKHGTLFYDVRGDDSTKLHEAAKSIVQRRIKEGGWYPEHADGDPEMAEQLALLARVKSEDGEAAWALMRIRRDYEYEGFDLATFQVIND